MVSRVSDWLRQAERNLRSAEINYQNELYEEACYESQQTAEKAVKALLSYFHKELRGHSITFLLQSSSIQIPGEILKCAQELDKHYIPSRYPDAYDQGAPADYYNEDDANRCLDCGKKILSWVKGIVGGTV
ncbi:MAG: HEPN domain-containing protein [Saccharolobus sp.]|uniref:HEPN domain-containing protein n=1 Tax=Saccharolobus TaxID=2100760 RepID=UPI001F0ED233|nr:HEPN domain-containing protein [Saccharolobus shibatae]MCH4816341.1 HEPN domain-containing protein [Saccharolobus shibatae]